MSGGVVGARAATLPFMVGGTEDTFRRVQPILNRMGRNVVHCGKHGTGLSAKLANNYLLAINNLATAEAMNFGVKAGLDPLILARIINSATGRNWASEVNNPVPGVDKAALASRQYQGGFASALMNKDLKLAITAAEQVRAPLLLSQAASDIYGKLAGDKRYAGLDFSAAYDYLQGNAKAKL
jgi:3-hydroxyisobutyrate dehydrogenase